MGYPNGLTGQMLRDPVRVLYSAPRPLDLNYFVSTEYTAVVPAAVIAVEVAVAVAVVVAGAVAAVVVE